LDKLTLGAELNRAEADDFGKVVESGLLEMSIVRDEEHALLDRTVIVEEDTAERRLYWRAPNAGTKELVMTLRPQILSR
jgi:hypothetical protein